MRRIPRAPVLVAALALACGPTPPRPLNLLLVSFDTLRADRTGAYGNDEWGTSPSPAIDALAAGGTLFETVYAPRGQTHPSLASLMTGKYPITTGVRENGFALPVEHRTLIEHLKRAGYHTGVFISNFSVTHPKEGWVARGADVAADGYDGRRAEESRNEARFQRIWDDRTEQAATSFLEQQADAPFAMWVHFYDVHKPYTPPPAMRDLFGLSDELPPVLRAPPEGDADNALIEQVLANFTLGGRDPSEQELARVRGLYDGGVRATDERLARLLRRLEELGVADDTLVVFTSDHGEELYDHNRYFFHGASIHDSTLRLPLVISGPGIPAGRRLPDLTRNIDVAPTVLELLGLPPDPGHEGRSVAPLLHAEPGTLEPVQAVIEWQDYIYAVSDGSRKLIWNPEHVWPRKAPYFYGPPEAGYRIDCIEGYDLVADPREQQNLLTDVDLGAITWRTGEGLPDGFAGLARTLHAFLADPDHRKAYDSQALDDDDMEHLRQLGYVGGSADRKDSVKRAPCVER